ncbi:hypothetical protein PHET_11955 [Paragonimus heterotremus]|uniref:Uncharacterized protein n=1 Tax=Paragonimus heterotremus TaxID=100268 RepID=A0A8J4WM04_9TREM|nr:hypothetical protein PHET_11955 [Paragonimus heterotremus]
MGIVAGCCLVCCPGDLQASHLSVTKLQTFTWNHCV